MSQDYFGPEEGDEFEIDDAAPEEEELEDPLGLDGAAEEEDEDFDPGTEDPAGEDEEAPDPDLELPDPADEEEDDARAPAPALSLPQIRPIPVQPEAPADEEDARPEDAAPAPEPPQKYYITRGRTYPADAVLTEEQRKKIIPEPRPRPDPASKHYVVCRHCRRALPCPNKQLAIRTLAVLEAQKCDCGSNRFYTPVATEDLSALLAQNNSRARVEEFGARSIEEIKKLVTQSVAIDLVRAAKPPEFNPTSYTAEMLVEAVLGIAGPMGVRPTAIWRPYEDFYREQLRVGEYEAILKTIEDRATAPPPNPGPAPGPPPAPSSTAGPPPAPQAPASTPAGDPPGLMPRIKKAAGRLAARIKGAGPVVWIKKALSRLVTGIRGLGRRPPPKREPPPEIAADVDDLDEESDRLRRTE